MLRRKRAFTDESLMLMERGLPRLVTTSTTSTPTTEPTTTKDETSQTSATDASTATTSTATTSTATTSTATTSSTSTDITATSLTITSSSLSTDLANIVPPSAENNPYIFRTSALSGTVFIAVGSIAGAILMLIFLWWSITKYLNYKRTKKDYLESMATQYPYGSRGGHAHHSSIFSTASSDVYSYGGDDEKLSLGHSRSQSVDKKTHEKVKKSKIGLFGGSTNDIFKTPTRNDSWESLSDAITNYGDGSVHRFNPIQDDIQYNNRRSLFISPTVEVMNLPRQEVPDIFATPKKQQTSIYNDYDTPLIPDLSKPEDVALSPQRSHRKTPSNDKYHRRNRSSANLSPSRSPTRTPIRTRNMARDHRKTPSMYLEDLLDDNY